LNGSEGVIVEAVESVENFTSFVRHATALVEWDVENIVQVVENPTTPPQGSTRTCWTGLSARSSTRVPHLIAEFSTGRARAARPRQGFGRGSDVDRGAA